MNPDLSNKSDLKDYNYNFQDPGDVILNDRGYLTDEELNKELKIIIRIYKIQQSLEKD
ncbi:MAG: hypothetical protein CM15mV51_0670 [uncultured marine virus]|nr:MAG: hypothetical protein CM15mV51_0670 [uncultured marine virus]